MKTINIIILLLCLVSAKGMAQPACKASLPMVDVDAFYAVNLPYEVLGGARPDLADIRIMNGDGKEVAWLLREDVDSLYQQSLLEVPLKMSRIATKEKESGIQLVFSFKYQIERLNFYISAPRYYNRKIELLHPYVGRIVTTLSNESGHPQSLPLGVWGDTLRLSIQNGDDQPLAVDSIKAYIRKYSLIAELKTGVSYTLTYGDKQASFPQYDLSFGKQLPDSLGQLTVGNIELLPTAVAQPEKSSEWLVFIQTYGIWLVIVLVIIQILYMARKIMKKEN